MRSSGFLVACSDEANLAWRIRLGSDSRERLIGLFAKFTEVAVGLTGAPPDEEPMMNVLARFEASSGWSVDIYPRAKHRPSFYFAEGDARILLSPAAAEMAGVITLPLERDFDRITPEHIRQMFAEVSIAREAFEELCDRVRSGAL